MLSKITRLILLALPSMMFFFIGESSLSRRKPLTIAFIIISLLIITIKREKFSDSARQGILHYQNGFTLLAMVICIITYFPVGGFISIPLLVDHSPAKTPAIFVLASGATLAGDPTLSGYQRVHHGIRLLQAGRASHLYLSSGYSDIHGFKEHAWLASFTKLVELDPASFTILKSKKITTTFTEAAYARKILAQNNIDHILLVTSGAHILRTCLTFCKAGFKVEPAPVHDRNSIFYTLDSFSSSFQAALHEWIGLAWYRLRGYI